ncbi:MAG: cupin domain-containing protein [Treponema sp.]|nr:cupin domain-containing protein [Treponema sp.]MCL2251246.1 cupin domain-containing protein [Treponema sp.]
MNEKTQTEFAAHVPERIKELREILEISALDMAKDTNIPFDTYTKYENGDLDIPISVLYTIANRLGTDVTVLLTGEEARMDSAAVCRKGKGVQIERYPGYEFSSLAYNFKHRIMEPLLVSLDSSKPQAQPVSHSGQEFNFVTEGQVMVTVGKGEHVLSPGDSIYFDARIPHAQSAVNGRAQFLTIILEKNS